MVRLLALGYQTNHANIRRRTLFRKFQRSRYHFNCTPFPVNGYHTKHLNFASCDLRSFNQSEAVHVAASWLINGFAFSTYRPTNTKQRLLSAYHLQERCRPTG